MPKKTDLQKHIDRLVAKHGGLRAAARAHKVDPAYLWRLRRGAKVGPTSKTLEKLGLKRIETLRPV